jgi:hypothetical protein
MWSSCGPWSTCCLEKQQIVNYKPSPQSSAQYAVNQFSHFMCKDWRLSIVQIRDLIFENQKGIVPAFFTFWNISHWDASYVQDAKQTCVKGLTRLASCSTEATDTESNETIAKTLLCLARGQFAVPLWFLLMASIIGGLLEIKMMYCNVNDVVHLLVSQLFYFQAGWCSFMDFCNQSFS